MQLTNGRGGVLVSNEDHISLQRLVTESALRVDEGYPETVSELFIEDGVLDLGGTQFAGKEAIKKWGEDLKANQTYKVIRHAGSNMRFTLKDDGTVEGTTLLTVFMDDELSSSYPWVIGEDHDIFVKTNDGWKFKYRKWVQLFMRPEGV